MPHVFISYVREDSEQVRRLADALEAHNISVWADWKNIAPGALWQEEIRRGIQDGAFFLCCFSRNYSAREKTYMNRELGLAFAELSDRPFDTTWFLPVILDDSTPPDQPISQTLRMGDVNWTDLHADWDGGVERLISVLGGVAATELLRSPRIGLQFLQGGRPRPMLLPEHDGDPMPKVLLRPEPFEIVAPNVGPDDAVMIAASADKAITMEMRHGRPHDEIPFFRPGSGVADYTYGTGFLAVDAEHRRHAHFAEERLEATGDGGRKCLISRFIGEPFDGRPRPGDRVYVCIFIRRAEPHLSFDNFDVFELSVDA